LVPNNFNAFVVFFVNVATQYRNRIYCGEPWFDTGLPKISFCTAPLHMYRFSFAY